LGRGKTLQPEGGWGELQIGENAVRLNSAYRTAQAGQGGGSGDKSRESLQYLEPTVSVNTELEMNRKEIEIILIANE
jgi:hypothetical protein